MTSLGFERMFVLFAQQSTILAYFLPSTIWISLSVGGIAARLSLFGWLTMMWYPSLVLHSAHFGLLVVEGSSSNATFSNSGISAPLPFHPSEPPDVRQLMRLHSVVCIVIPCRALSSENSLATCQVISL